MTEQQKHLVRTLGGVAAIALVGCTLAWALLDDTDWIIISVIALAVIAAAGRIVDGAESRRERKGTRRHSNRCSPASNRHPP